MANANDPSILKTISMAAHGAQRLADEHASGKADAKLTAETLAEAIKLAQLPPEHEHKLSPTTVLAAVKFLEAGKHAHEHEPAQPIHIDLSPEKLAIALKTIFNEPHLEKAHADTAIGKTIVTAETVTKAVELAKK